MKPTTNRRTMMERVLATTKNTLTNISKKTVTEDNNWRKFKSAVVNTLAQTRFMFEGKMQPDSHDVVLVDNPEWLIVIPMNMKASEHHGKDTDWSVSNIEQDYFAEYFLKHNATIVFCIQKNTSNKWAIYINHKHSDRDIYLSSVKDVRRLTKNEFEKQTNLPTEKIHKLVAAKQQTVSSGREELKKHDLGWIVKHTEPGQRNADLEKKLLKSAVPKWIYQYAHKVIQGRWQEAEGIIATHPKWTYYYCVDNFDNTKGWPLGELTLAKDPAYAVSYARDIIKRQFPLAEKTIAADPMWSYYYAVDVLHNRFPLGEKAIATDPQLAAEYNRERARWGRPSSR